MNKYTLEITEAEAWAVATALFEYAQDSISDEHGKLTLAVYTRLKTIMLKKSEELFLESRSCTCSSYQIENYGHKCGR